MPDVTQYLFNHQEVVTALLRNQGIREGIWALTINFGFSATNVENLNGAPRAVPAAILPVLGIGLRRTNKLDNLAVDAASIYRDAPSAETSTKTIRRSARTKRAA